MNSRKRPRSRHDQPPPRGEAKRQPARVATEPEPGTAQSQGLGSSANHADVRPSRDDRCAECGQAVDVSWVSYRPDPADPEALIQHFGGTVNAGPAEPRVDRPEPRIRDFRYPDDLGPFLHSWCAPRVKLPEKLQKEISEILAEALVAHYRRTEERWAQVRQLSPGQGTPPRCHAQVASVVGRRVFTMARVEWERFRSYEGQLVEIELERTPPDGIAASSAAIAVLAAECSVHTERIEVWRYTEQEQPGPHNVQDYLVLQNFRRQINLPKFAERVSIQDTPGLRKYLRDHVFIVKERPDKGRWEAKARSLEQVVFLST